MEGIEIKIGSDGRCDPRIRAISMRSLLTRNEGDDIGRGARIASQGSGKQPSVLIRSILYQRINRMAMPCHCQSLLPVTTGELVWELPDRVRGYRRFVRVVITALLAKVDKHHHGAMWGPKR